jgi:enoyl-CoA hydratase/carnithine racemase
VPNAYNTLIVSRPRPGVALAELNRPGRMNAITFEMFAEFRALQHEIDADPEVRVLVLTGSGRGFCAGLDLDQAATLPSMPVVEMLDGQEAWAEAICGFRTMRTPVIAAVNAGRARGRVRLDARGRGALIGGPHRGGRAAAAASAAGDRERRLIRAKD